MKRQGTSRLQNAMGCDTPEMCWYWCIHNSYSWPFWSHFILSGFKYYVLIFKNKYNVIIVLMLYCKSLLLLLSCDTGKVRDRCGGMWMGQLCNYRCNYIY